MMSHWFGKKQKASSPVHPEPEGSLPRGKARGTSGTDPVDAPVQVQRRMARAVAKVLHDHRMEAREDERSRSLER